MRNDTRTTTTARRPRRGERCWLCGRRAAVVIVGALGDEMAVCGRPEAVAP